MSEQIWRLMRKWADYLGAIAAGNKVVAGKFEQSYDVQQVALLTVHKDWRNLRRYTKLRPEDLHRSDEE